MGSFGLCCDCIFMLYIVYMLDQDGRIHSVHHHSFPKLFNYNYRLKKEMKFPFNVKELQWYINTLAYAYVHQYL